VNCPERIQPISPKEHLYKTYKNNLLWQKLPITVAQSGTKNGLMLAQQYRCGYVSVWSMSKQGFGALSAR
jgi:hypothetical protein